MSFGFGVGDIISVTELAIPIYRECYVVARGAPQEFQLFLSEVSNLSNALKILQDDLTNQSSIFVRAGEVRVKMAPRTRLACRCNFERVAEGRQEVRGHR
jgi:hypothetical protein